MVTRRHPRLLYLAMLALVLALCPMVEDVVKEAETMAGAVVTHNTPPIIRLHIPSLVTRSVIKMDIWLSTATTEWITLSRADILLYSSQQWLPLSIPPHNKTSMQIQVLPITSLMTCKIYL